MNFSLYLLFTIVALNCVTAQKSDFKIGIEPSVKIELIDKKLKVFDNQQNSNLRFKIINSSTDSIFIPTPSNSCGSTPQFFDLFNDKVDCILIDCEMQARPLEDFILIHPESDKVIELTSGFFMNSCAYDGRPSTAVLRYRPQKYLERFMKKYYKTEDSKRILRNLLYSNLESEVIQIIYE